MRNWWGWKWPWVAIRWCDTNLVKFRIFGNGRGFWRMWPWMLVSTSNGKSSIVEERLYSFFVVPKQNEASFFSYFLFLTINNEDVRFPSILHNFRRFYFVLFRFLKFLEYTNSFYLRLWKCWANSLRFTSFFQNFGTTWTFSIWSYEFKEQAIRFVFDLSELRTYFIFASILTSWRLILCVFRFDI